MKIVNCLGFLGSKVIFFPLSFRFSCAASADVMAEEVARTYSLAEVREGLGRGAEGQRAFCTVLGWERTSW